jgi:hypothetical protein
MSSEFLVILVVAGLAALVGAGVGSYLATEKAMQGLSHDAKPVLGGLEDATTLLREEAKAVTAASKGVERMSWIAIAFVALSVLAIFSLLRVVKYAVIKDLQNNEEFRKAIRQIANGKPSRKRVMRRGAD